jgi:hypothetical protein
MTNLKVRVFISLQLELAVSIIDYYLLQPYSVSNCLLCICHLFFITQHVLYPKLDELTKIFSLQVQLVSTNFTFIYTPRLQ